MLREGGPPLWIILVCQNVDNAFADLGTELIIAVLEILEQGLDEVVVQLGYVEELESGAELLQEFCMLPPQANLIVYVLIKRK